MVRLKHRGGEYWRARAGLQVPAALLAGALLAGVPAVANPLDGQVVGGQATIATTAPGTLTIQQQTPRAAINWRSFNISPTETTQFVQPGPNAIALNRVQAGDPSVIAGRLIANGQLVLVNPSGVVFTRGSQVNVNSLIATPTDISTANFMAGRMKFDIPSSDPRARIVNNGSITVAEKGLAALVGPGVANNGVISARLGSVVLGGAQTYTLDFYGDGLIKFAIDSGVNKVPLGHNGQPLTSLVSNSGLIDAPGGTVLVTANAAAGILNNVVDARGTINAPTYAGTPGAVTIDAGAGNAAQVAGYVNVTGLNPGEVGGRAVVTGGTVNLAGTARIDARGAAGGGKVEIGGGPHGADPLVRNALQTNISVGAMIDASATGSGNGGNVAVWSDGATTFNGIIRAKGGPNGGDGGWVETSGHILSVGAAAAVIASAPHGAPGTWLLDPWNTTISTSATSNSTCDATITCTSTGTGANVNNGDIATALSAGTNVTITTGATGSEAGNITVSAPIVWSSSGSSALTLTAAGNIAINAVIDGCCATTLTLNAGGTVTQTAAIGVATLTGSSVGGATLTNTGNFFAFGPWSNTGSGDLSVTVNTCCGLTTSGTISNSAGNITLSETSSSIGGISLGGDVTAAGHTVTLNAPGSISQASGVITAGTLTGSSVGGASLSNSNAIATFGPWSNTGGGFVSLSDTTSLALAGAISNAGGTLSLQTTASAGLTISQNIGSTITAGTLTVNTTGGATLDQPGNQVGTISTGFFTNSGSVSFTNAAPLSVGFVAITGAGDLKLTTTGAGSSMNLTNTIELFGASATVTLNSAGTISQTGGTIIANTLTGSSVGGASFNFADNGLNNFGPFSDTVGGAITLRDAPASSLTIIGAITTSGDVSIFVTSGGGGCTLACALALAGDPDLLINSPISGATVTLSAAGSITENPGGSITATNLIAVTLLSGSGAITLDQDGANTVSGNVTLASRDNAGTTTQAGTISFTDTSGFTIAAATPTVPISGIQTALSLAGIETTGTATLNAGGAIAETGTIGSTAAHVATLSGSSVGGATLAATGNAVDVFGSWSDSGTGSAGISFTDGQSFATFNSGLINSTGDITLRVALAGGTLTVDTDSFVVASGRTITLQQDNLVLSSGVSAGTNGTVVIIPETAGKPIDIGTTVAAGDLVLDAGILSSEVTAGTLVVGNTGAGKITVNDTFFGGNITNLTLISGGAETFAADVTVPGTLTMTAGGSIDQTAGAITAATLSGSSVGGATLTGANLVTTFGGFSDTGASSLGISFTNAQALSTALTISSASGPITLKTTAGGMTLGGDITSASGEIKLDSAGGITQTAGAIDPGSLLILSVGSVSLPGANTVDLLAATLTGAGSSLLFNNTAHNLAVDTIEGVNGITTSNGAVLLSTTTSGSITLNQGIAAGAATVTLASAGTILEAGGIITAATLTGSSVGGATLAGANMVGTLGGFGDTGAGSAGISFTDGQALATTGTISSASGPITLKTTTGGMTLGGNLTAAGNTMALISAGAIDQTAGVITAGTLTGSSVGGASLTTANLVGTLGPFSNTTSGNFSFTNAQSLATSGTVQNAASTGSLTLEVTSGTLTVGGGGVTSTNGTITLIADAMNLGAAVNAGTARAILEPATSGLAIALGTKPAGTLGLTQSDLNEVTAAVLQIGSPSAGAITVTAAISALAGTNVLTLVNNGAISETAALGSLAVPDLRVSSTGPVTLDQANNIQVIAADATNAVTIANGAGHPLTIGIVDGVTGITTSNSAITLTADSMIIGQQVNAGSGTVTIAPATFGTAIDIGTKPAGALGLTQAELNNVTAGLLRIGDLFNTGNITITAPTADVGTGWKTLSLLTGLGFGISQNAGATLTVSNLNAAGKAGVTLTQSGNAIGTLAGAAESGAFSVVDSLNLTVGSVDPGLGSGFGVGIITQGQPITLVSSTGTTSLTVSNLLDTTHSFGSAAPGANITLTFDNMSLSAPVIGGSGIVQLLPKTGGRAISLGNTVAGDLSLLQTDLNEVTAGVLRIGDLFSTGNITITAPITDVGTGWTTLSLLTGLGFGISQNADATLTVSNLNAAGNVGVTLTQSGNAIGTLAGAAESGAFSVVDSLNLTVGSVDPGLGSGFGVGIITQGQPITLASSTGATSLTVSNLLDTTHSFGGAPAGANITLTFGNMSVSAPVIGGSGLVALISGGTITEGIGGVINSGSLLIQSAGAVSLTGANTVGTLAAQITGAAASLAFNNTGNNLTVGTIGGVGGVSTDNGAVMLSTTTGGNLTLSQSVAAGTGTVTLVSAGTIDQTGGIITAGALGGSSVGGTELDSANLIGTFTGFSNTGSGAVGLSNGQTLIVGNLSNSAGGITLVTIAGGIEIDDPISAAAASNVTIAAAGNLTIDGAGSVSGGSVTLATLGNFTNNAGAGAITAGPGGRWLVYSTNPNLDNDGGLAPAFIQYAAPYDLPTLTGTTPAAAGNGLLYSLPATLTLTNVTKVYDATTGLPTIAAAYTATGAVAGDVVVLDPAGVNGAYASKNVGSGIDVTLSGMAFSATRGGIPVFGYTLGAVSGSPIGTITPAALTITASDRAKIYGQTLALGTTAFTTSGLFAGDSVTGVTLASAGAAGTAGVGSYAITASGAVGIGVGNYTITFVNGTLTVSPALLTITAADRAKIYGQTLALGSTGFTTAGLVNGDTVTGVTLASAGAAGTAGVGNYAITASGAVGTGLGNYTISFVNGTLTVSPALLTITAADRAKIYGQTLALGSTGFTTAGLVNGDTVTGVTLASAGAAGTAGVGNYAITASGAVGTGLGNYTISFVNGTLTVSPALLTITAADRAKIYGQTLVLGSTGFTTAGLVNGDTVTGVTLASAGAAGTAGVGNYAITASGAVGTGLGNYTISFVNGTLTVSPALLTITAADRAKTYGQTLALGSTGFTTAGLVNGDTVTGVTLASAGAAGTAGVGNYAITASGAVGTGVGNYTISFVNGTLTVSPALLTITATDRTKTYGQTLALGSTGFTTAGLLNGDTVTGVTLASAGAAGTVGVGNYAITASGAVGTGVGNYTISFANGTLTVSPAVLTAVLTGTIGKIYDGTNAANGLGPDNYALVGIVNGDTVGLNNPASGTYATANVGTGIAVSILKVGLIGAAGNYVLASNSISGNIGTISPATLNVGLTGLVRKQFDGTTAATLAAGNYTLSGIIGRDIVLLNDPVAGNYATPNPGSFIPVSVTGLALAGPNAGNYVLASTGATGNIGEIFASGVPAAPAAPTAIPSVELVTPPQTAAKFDAGTVYLPFAGNLACIPSSGYQKASSLPLISGFGISDTTNSGFTLLDQPYAAAELQGGVLMPVTFSPCQAQDLFGQVLEGLGTTH